MATLYSDGFAGTGALGAEWNSNSASYDRASDELRHSDTAFQMEPLETTTTAMAAVADCKVSITARTGAGFSGGPAVRKQSGVADFYYLRVHEAGSGLLVERVTDDGATEANLLTVGSYTHTIGDKLTLEVSGSGATVTLRAYRNDVQVGSTISDTDAARITAAGQTGVKAWNYTDTNLFDDFLVEDLAGGGGPTIPIVMHHRRMMAG